MPLEPRDASFLWDMIVSARGIVATLAKVTFQEYQKEENLRLVIERRIEILGEAARRLSPAFQNAHPEIPWKHLIAQRNVLAHEYDEIDDERIWQLCVKSIPLLLSQLEQLAPPPPS